MRLLLLAFLLLTFGQSMAEPMTEAQAREYMASLDTPPVKEIRKYLNDCLSGLDLGYPCEPNEVMPHNSIKGQPREFLEGRFALLKVSPFNYGGDVYLIMFNTPPHLMAHVWVYNEGHDPNAPDVRSFFVGDTPQDKWLALASALGPDFLSDPLMTR